MSAGFYKVPTPQNETVRSYALGSSERASLQAKLSSMRSEVRDIPMVIGGKEVRTGTLQRIAPPHDHRHTLGHFHRGGKPEVTDAIHAALKAKAQWENMAWESRISIFLKAAELIAGPYRDELNASTMLGQSKNAYQAEIDSACELIDFFRFNASFAAEIYGSQPISGPGVWNRTEYRPLEGFVFALTPFNFTAIAGNLPSSAAIMGNTVVWKPADTQIYSAHVIMKVLQQAGLPPGVINLVFVSGPDAGEVIFNHPDFAGIHFTGSTGVFQHIWKTIGNNISGFKSYPRIVGETGGKDFIVAHPTADVPSLITAISRGAFEYQGQKCSAASRVYIPSNIWPEVKEGLLRDLASFKMGGTEDFSNFINAVIDEKSFDKLAGYIQRAKEDKEVEVIAGGKVDKSIGYFIEPTILVTSNPAYVTMCEELFGPVLTVYVYPADEFEKTLQLVDATSEYALTGSIFSQDRYAIETAYRMLRHAAGNFYINDKCTGAVVGQQPFGGARGSGTNDKAGSMQNLLRWVSVRTVKETFVPPSDYRYPFLGG